MKMQALNFPTYHLNIRVFQEKKQIFDRLRKKFVALTPEEWVRQHLVWYLIEELKYPEGLIKLEHSFIVNNNKVRSDIVVFSTDANPILLAECKAPNIKIGNNTLQQAGMYNIVTKTKYLLVTNGIKNICCKIDFKTGSITFVKEIPDYQSL
ncbi:MAG: restriction endonuclease subunit R [Bacteroidetes bacterium CG02_land_8_20_14_3_00_31_25]|nr:type I restriction enzyme HsdR N-terminal domain-containing protein [Bacteroidota bacterium]PIV59133.1 MAG: restriction endonuclease subunit R [Bacteroidetes bacterium CG02_land_8_20_14_3_00_31_25]PIX36586.1 MAG: restriction endonuclease subunit R [Bacteroidetes bacterium CG_4_8_14_3_um_filter_31_14]PIY05789.1 MAG: restriction endonuclease subunit R [Bacteroidetes bacterium CG_4_10_14_3_um_filter_31_20]